MMRKDELGSIVRRDARASVLVVEPDPLMLTAIGAVLDMQGHRVMLTRQSADALSGFDAQSIDAVILSIDDVDDGSRFASDLRESSSRAETPIIFLVPTGIADAHQKLAALGGVFSMSKPIEPDDLIELVDKVLWLPHVARARMGTPDVHWNRQKDWVSLDPSPAD